MTDPIEDRLGPRAEAAGYERSRALLLFAILTTATAWPLLRSYLDEGIKAPFRFFAADAFYYLAVAKHSAGAPFYTFDGLHPTNGFHPLLQYYLTAAFEILGIHAAHDQILFSFFSSIIFTAIGTGLAGVALLRLTGRFVLSLLGILPGAYYLLWSAVNPSLGGQWAFAAGMESGFSILLFGLLLYLVVVIGLLDRLTPRRLLAASSLLTLIVLARLDDIFIFLPFLGVIMVASDDRRERVRLLAYASIVPFVTIGSYLLYNLSYAGMLMPASGLAKGGFALGEHLINLGDAIVGFSMFVGSNVWKDRLVRSLQMLGPMIAAIGALVLFRWGWRERGRKGIGPAPLLLGGLSLYVLVKGAYNLLNVVPWHQGHWYYPLSIMTFNMLVTIAMARSLSESVWSDGFALHPANKARAGRWISRGAIAIGALAGVTGLLLIGASGSPLLRAHLLQRPESNMMFGLLMVAIGAAAVIVFRVIQEWSGRDESAIPLWPALSSIAAVVYLIVIANAFTDTTLASDRNHLYYDLWARRQAVGEGLRRIAGDARIVEFDDGIVSYSLDFPVMSGLGFMLDRNALAARRDGVLLDTAYARGFTILTTLVYLPLTAAERADPAVLRSGISNMVAEKNIAKWDFRVVYHDEAAAISFIEFTPRSPGPIVP